MSAFSTDSPETKSNLAVRTESSKNSLLSLLVFKADPKYETTVSHGTYDTAVGYTAMQLCTLDVIVTTIGVLGYVMRFLL